MENEYIICQEGDVYAYETTFWRKTLSTKSFDIGEFIRFVGEQTARGYQVGYLVLTNRNLFFVTSGLVTGFIAEKLEAKTPFGLGRKIFAWKKLSLPEVYRYYEKNPGGIKIPLTSIVKVMHRKPLLGRPSVIIVWKEEEGYGGVTFSFKGIFGGINWPKVITEYCKKARAQARAPSPPPPQAPLCPSCGKPLTWIPQYRRWYCSVSWKYA